MLATTDSPSNGTPAARTVVLRVQEAPVDGHHPVALHLDDGRPGWLERPLAVGRIPVTLEAGAATPAPEDVAGRLSARSGTAVARRAAAQRVGFYLHQLLFAGDIGPAWTGLLAEGRPLSLLLDLRAERIRRLPFELLHKPDDPFPLIEDARVSCARAGPLELARPEREVDPPLRLLVVVGDDERVRADDERDEICEALVRVCGLIDARVLKRPTQDDLVDAIECQRPHILHFIGHGHRDDLGSLLEFAPDDAGRDGWTWRAADMAADLQGRCPRLVVVNACRTGEREGAASPGEPVAWDMAHALLHVGARAVVAMQGDVDAHAAVGFSQALYAALADDAPIDRAVAAGRRAMRVLDADAPDRWLPTLTLGAPPDRVLPLRCAVPDAARRLIEDAHEELVRFVDRSDERRRVWDHTVAGGGVLVIDGAGEVGKSALARWCVGAAQLAGVNGAYVQVGSPEHAVSWPALLRATPEP